VPVRFLGLAGPEQFKDDYGIDAHVEPEADALFGLADAVLCGGRAGDGPSAAVAGAGVRTGSRGRCMTALVIPDRWPQ